MTLADDLYDQMAAALQKAPKPKGMDDQTYARSVLDALALAALKRAAKLQESRRLALEVQQKAIENGSRYYLANPRDGLAVDVFPNELPSFAKWASVKLSDLKAMVEGAQREAGNWRPDNTIRRIDARGNPLVQRQLARDHVPPPLKAGDPIRWDQTPENYKAALQTVYVPWQDMTYQAAIEFGKQRRQPLPAGAIIASNY